MVYEEHYEIHQTVGYSHRRFTLPSRFLKVPLIENQLSAFPQETVQEEKTYPFIALYNFFITERLPYRFSGDLITINPYHSITLPRHLDDFLKPDGQITILGVGPRLELWLPYDYEQYRQKADRDKWQRLARINARDARKATRRRIRQNYQEAVKRGLFKPDQPLDDYDYKNLEFLDLSQLEKKCSSHKA